MRHIFEKQSTSNKQLVIILSNIFGLNKSLSKQICFTLGLNPSVRMNSLTKVQIYTIRSYITNYYNTERELFKTLKNIKHQQISIKSYKGLRYMKGLPVNGQRTHTNAKTKKKLKN